MPQDDIGIYFGLHVAKGARPRNEGEGKSSKVSAMFLAIFGLRLMMRSCMTEYIYTATIPTIVAYEVMQDFYHQEYSFSNSLL